MTEAHREYRKWLEYNWKYLRVPPTMQRRETRRKQLKISKSMELTIWKEYMLGD